MAKHRTLKNRITLEALFENAPLAPFPDLFSLLDISERMLARAPETPSFKWTEEELKKQFTTPKKPLH